MTRTSLEKAHADAYTLIDDIVDARTFVSWDQPAEIPNVSAEYADALANARSRTGMDESVLTGRGKVQGREIAIIVCEFGFLGGSIGRTAATRIISAIRRATYERLPLLVAPASGGTRMQEGTTAFVLMADITRAVMDHRAQGLPYLAYLRHPTTGGVYASWGSLAQVTAAEPGALIGFLGPKVYRALRGEPFPAGVQTAEHLAAHGIIDAIVASGDLCEFVDRVLAVLVDPPLPPLPSARSGSCVGVGDPWHAVERTRAPGRVSVSDLLRYGATGTVRLHRTAIHGQSDPIVVALTRFCGQPCVFVGQDRTCQEDGAEVGPAALQRARRGILLAQELRLPLITVIDTPGAELSQAAEEGAVGGEIARCIAALATISVPTVSVLLGQGCGGGALALFPAVTKIATSSAWLAPLPPEGASAIVYGDTSHAAEMARRQSISAPFLRAQGIIDHVVEERAGDSNADIARAVAAAVAQAIAQDRAAGVGAAPASAAPYWPRD